MTISREEWLDYADEWRGRVSANARCPIIADAARAQAERAYTLLLEDLERASDTDTVSDATAAAFTELQNLADRHAACIEGRVDDTLPGHKLAGVIGVVGGGAALLGLLWWFGRR